MDDRYKGRVSDRIREAEMIGIPNIVIVGQQWITSSEVGLVVSTIEKTYRADKTLDSLKTHFESFQLELESSLKEKHE